MNSHEPTRLLRRLASLLLLPMALAPCPAQDTGGYTGGAGDRGYGIVAINNTNSIRVINPVDWTITEPMLTGELGSFGGGLFDIAITPDRRTALISNFGDAKVFMLDMTVPTAPMVMAAIEVGFFAEDIDITPNGRYALVSDGGFSPKLCVIDIRAKSARVFDFTNEDNPDLTPSCQSVAIMPDNQTVLCANYFGGKVEVFLLGVDGTLTHTQSIEMPPQVAPALGSAASYVPRIPRPVNVAASPDGIHAAAVAPGNSADPTDPYYYGGTSIYLLKRIGPGQMYLLGANAYEFDAKNPQCAVFSREGRQLYVSATSMSYPMPPYDPMQPNKGIQTWVRIYNISGDNFYLIKDIPLPGRGTSQLFGVETIALDQSGLNVLVTNPTVSGGLARIDVVSTITRSLTRSYLLPDQTYTNYWLNLPPEDRPDPVTETERPIPTGIAFTAMIWPNRLR